MIQPVTFVCSGSKLKGYFFPSSRSGPSTTVIFLQGFPGTEGDELICELLSQAGANVFTFNYRGTFSSEGYWSFSNALEDISAGLRFLQEPNSLMPYPIGTGKLALGGWSFGSGILPAGAVQNSQINKLFMVAGRNFGEEARRIEHDPAYAAQVRQNLENLRAPAGPLRFKGDLIADLIANQDRLDHEKLAPSLTDRDILLIGGWLDEVSPIETCTIPFYRSLVASGASRVRIEAVPDDHEFSDCKNQLVLIISNWLQAN